MHEFEQNGSRVITHDDGTLEVINQSGASVKVGKDGVVRADLQKLKGVGIKTIFEVVSHRIMRESDSTIHQIEFVNGGSAKISYTKSGKVNLFECNRITFALTVESEIILSAYNK